MKCIFISHAGEDSEKAEQLANDLRNANHEIRIDLYDLDLGDNSIKFMNDSIAEAHTIIILLSKHTKKAKWQNLEIDSAIWNEVAQDGGRCLVIRLDNTDVPATLGPKIFLPLNDESWKSPNKYREAFEKLCKAVVPDKSVSSIFFDATGRDSKNPFWRVRAEYYEDFPDLLGSTFAAPDALKTNALEDMKPCFVEGSRGTGKSMFLMSLRARILHSRSDANQKVDEIFGFYLKLMRGAVCNMGIITASNEDPSLCDYEWLVLAADMFEQEIVVCFLESLVSEIEYCIQYDLFSCDRHEETDLVDAIFRIVCGAEVTTTTVGSIENLKHELAHTHKKISDYIRRKIIYKEPVTVPITSLNLDCFRRVVRCVKEKVPYLSKSLFVILLDEYENLFPYQQKVINGFIKLAPPDFTIKVAKKIGCAETSGTNTGQDLQEIHDFTRLSLVYDVGEPAQLSAFRTLLKRMVENIRNTPNKSVDELLPEFESAEVEDSPLLDEIAKLSKISITEFKALSAEHRNEKITYNKQAAIYRVLQGKKGKHKDKRFSGFHELSFLSSGVIRYFQEILGVAYHLQYERDSHDNSTLSFSPENQTKAVHIVSQHNLTTLSRNVAKDGEVLKYFVLDIGDCLRQKLMKHSSEPEAGRITLVDPQQMDGENNSELSKLLELGIREGVFQTKDGRPAFKPKHSSDPQPTEFNICRIYAPVLQISPRLRWRTNFTCEDLTGLIEKDSRASTKRKLMKKVSKVKLNKVKTNETQTKMRY